MRNQTLKRFATAVGLCLIAVALPAAANAASLHQGSTGSSGAAVTGQLPGEVQWTYYQTDEVGSICPPLSNLQPGFALCNTQSHGDNILRLINPNGAANGNLAGAKTQTICAMIYVFDNAQEMGECCGCPLSSAQLATFSVDSNLTSNWSLQNNPSDRNGRTPDNGLGSIAIVAAAPNTIACLGGGAGRACNGGCDPTNVPGYSVATASNLLGSITHHQSVAQPIGTSGDFIATPDELAEIPLSDDAGGDPTNLIYLQAQCGAIIGNGSGGGICTCPIE